MSGPGARARDFDLPTSRLAGLEWGPSDGLPVFALHGWLDNAGSFNLLAPLLPDCHLLALDAAGHGLSANRSPDAGYNIWQDLGDILEVAEQLGWERFSLVGHSRGAAVAMLFAGTFPERVDRLALIEGGLPLVGDAADAPATLASALVKLRELRGKPGRVFATRREAVEERANGFSKVSLAAAEILAERALREVDGGWQWHADPRLKAGSEIKLTHELARAFVTRVAAPVQSFLAERSPFAHTSLYREMLGEFANLELQRLPGGHHLHLEGGELEIARRLAPFLRGS